MGAARVKIVTTEEMRLLEKRCAEGGLTWEVLMEKAGLGVAQVVKELLSEAPIPPGRILVLVGPGNNGGDGLVAARHLHDRGFQVSLYGGNKKPKGRNLELVMERALPFFSASEDEGGVVLQREIASADVVIDALFGTGMSRPVENPYRGILEMLRRVKSRLRLDSRPLVVAVDMPSGLNGDTGEVDDVAPYADVTVTLGCPKFGLFAFPGADRVGRLVTVDIGIPSSLTDPLSADLLTDGWVREALPARPKDAHKGTFGRLLVVAGSVSYVGAACLACSGALRVGGGLVTLAAARSLHPIVAARLIEATHLPLPEAEPGVIGATAAEVLGKALPEYEALLLGCGLGQHPATAEFVKLALLESHSNQRIPLVLDADGLNLVSRTYEWWRKLAEKVIVTPHPGEMARLTGMPVSEIQRNRVETARQKAQEWKKTIVLKGAYTVVAGADGRVALSPFANPGLASAGTGDVLAGCIAGLLAQGLAPFEAAACGVYIHGKAGEKVREELGDMGMTAGDLTGQLPLAIKGLRGTDSGRR
ncbi:MAG: NAD(P)H-hydrate epimerase [Dehalococcoidia bacterium]|nr:NAD(P)H-hydrate epimerase [Dehalococcoidia bacterium]